MVQLKSKGSQKRSAETSSTSPLLKKRRVLPDAPQKSSTDESQKSGKVSKKLSKESQKRSAEALKISSTSPQNKKTQVLPDAPLKLDTTADGQKGSKVPKKLAKGSLKRSAETSPASPRLKKRRVLPEAPQESGPAGDRQKDVKVSKKVAKESRDEKCANKALQVYISRIPKEVGKKELREHFSQFGSIRYISLPKQIGDWSAHRGFAFIEFVDELARRKALVAGQLEVNGQLIPIRTMKSSESVPKQRTNHPLEVYVGQIPEEVSKKDLREHFSHFGAIKNIILSVRPGDPAANRGFALIKFADLVAKKKALAAGQLEVNGQVVSILLSAPKEEINRALEVFVGQLPQEVSKEDLKEHFSQFGSVKHITLPAKPEDRSVHKGFAFVEFVDKRAKEKALAADQHKVRGQIVNLRDTTFSKVDPKKEMNHALKVFLKNVPEEVSKEDLREHFSHFGAIKNITLPVKPEDPAVKRGFAFIEFADLLAKKKALAAGQLEVNGQVVSILISAPKEEKKRELEVLVGQIPQEVSEEDLKEHFSQFGGVKYITLPTKPDDRSAHKGFARIAFVDKCAKKKALAADEHEVNGNIVFVRNSEAKESAPKKEVNHAFQVFVSQIPRELGKGHLKEHFSQFGNIKDISLPSNIKKPFGHRSFAFIEFTDELAKEKAMAADKHEVNGHVVSASAVCKAQDSQNKTSKLTTGQKLAPKVKRNHALEVFVNKIPQEVKWKDLKEHFSQFGSIIRMTLPTKPEDRSAHRGFAFVEFADELAKENALETHQHDVNGQVIFVRDCKSTPAPKKETNKALEVIVRRIPKEVNEEDLKEHFSQFGSVTSITLPTDAKDPSAHRGFGFVVFADELAREEALAAGQHELNGRVVSVHISESPDSRGVDLVNPINRGEWVHNSLVASGLPASTTAQTLSLHFSHYGKVLQAKMVRTQGKRNSAVIVFEDEAGVNAALKEDHEIDYSSIDVKKANLSDIPLDGQKSVNESRNGELEESDEDMEQESDEENEDDDDDDDNDDDENEDDDDDDENEDDDDDDDENEDDDDDYDENEDDDDDENEDDEDENEDDDDEENEDDDEENEDEDDENEDEDEENEDSDEET